MVSVAGRKTTTTTDISPILAKKGSVKKSQKRFLCWASNEALHCKSEVEHYPVKSRARSSRTKSQKEEYQCDAVFCGPKCNARGCRLRSACTCICNIKNVK